MVGLILLNSVNHLPFVAVRQLGHTPPTLLQNSLLESEMQKGSGKKTKTKTNAPQHINGNMIEKSDDRLLASNTEMFPKCILHYK